MSNKDKHLPENGSFKYNSMLLLGSNGGANHHSTYV